MAAPRASRPLPSALRVASAATLSAAVQWNVVTSKTFPAENDAASEPRNVLLRRTMRSGQNDRLVARPRYCRPVRTMDETPAPSARVSDVFHGRPATVI